MNGATIAIAIILLLALFGSGFIADIIYYVQQGYSFRKAIENARNSL